MTKYIKTTITEFEQFDKAEWDRKYKSCQHLKDWRRLAERLDIDRHIGQFIIQSREGNIRLQDGDWIATGVNGDHWSIGDDVFKKTYSKLPVISASVAEFIAWCKGQNTPLRDALYFKSNGFMYSKQDKERIGGWITDHQDEFARAWLDGCQIETKS